MIRRDGSCSGEDLLEVRSAMSRADHCSLLDHGEKRVHWDYLKILDDPGFIVAVKC